MMDTEDYEVLYDADDDYIMYKCVLLLLLFVVFVLLDVTLMLSFRWLGSDSE